MKTNTVYHGDAHDVLSDFDSNSVQTVVTSPPYWGQRDYGYDGQIGIEDDASDYVDELVSVLDECKRVLQDTGSLWLNIGDTYNGCTIVRRANESHHPRKGDDGYEQQLSGNRSDGGPKRRSSSQYGLRRQSRMFIPSRVARRLCENLKYRLRDEVVWVKPSPKPEGRVSTRLQQSHEKIYRFVISESAMFHDNHDVSTDVWEIQTASDVDHPAPFPEEIPKRAIQLTSNDGDTVLDPFCGSGTTLAVADRLNRSWVGVDKNEKFVQQSQERVKNTQENIE